MLPLAGPHFPASLEELVAALRAGFRGRGVSARDVRAKGEWPRLTELVVDLTDAQLSRATRLPNSAAGAQPAISVENFAMSASPLFFEKTPVRLDLRARGAECGFARDSAGDPVLGLIRTGAGSVSIEAERADLEVALKTIASGFLAKQGADVKSAKLELIDRGPQSLGFRAEITAKAFVMTARIVISGQLDLDDQLNLRVRDLATSGDGMIASLAGSFLRPRFAEVEKRTIPLASYSFAGITLHRVRISGGNTLRIEAEFGS